MQTVLYIWTYLRVAERLHWIIPNDDTDLTACESESTLPTMQVVLPTGAMGNIAAGFLTKLMGVPIATLTAAVNVNDIVHRAFTTGAFHRCDTMHRTLSEAINIQVPYNFERLLYYLTDGNHVLVQSCYQTMTDTGRMDVPADVLAKLQAVFRSARVTDAQMCSAAATVLADYQYLADPNTAVAMAAAYQLGYLQRPNGDGGGTTGSHDDLNAPTTTLPESDRAATKEGDDDPTTRRAARVTVLLATASPCKFENAVVAAVGAQAWKDYTESDQFPATAKTLLQLPEQPPTVYPAQPGVSLAETQLEWEALARQVVAGLEGAH
jgi:threonine synthase